MSIQYCDKPIQLNLTPRQFLVIYEFLYRVKIGHDNAYQIAVAHLFTNGLESKQVEELLNECRDQYGEIDIQITASDQDGLVFEIKEID